MNNLVYTCDANAAVSNRRDFPKCRTRLASLQGLLPSHVFPMFTSKGSEVKTSFLIFLRSAFSVFRPRGLDFFALAFVLTFSGCVFCCVLLLFLLYVVVAFCSCAFTFAFASNVHACARANQALSTVPVNDPYPLHIRTRYLALKLGYMTYSAQKPAIFQTTWV